MQFHLKINKILCISYAKKFYLKYQEKSELNRDTNNSEVSSWKRSQLIWITVSLSRLFFIKKDCQRLESVRLLFTPKKVLSTKQIKVRAPTLYSVSSRKLLAHVWVPYEQKRESLSGANLLSSLPHGSPFSGCTKRKGNTGKMTFTARRPSTRHSDSSIRRGRSTVRIFSLSKRWQCPLIFFYLIKKFIYQKKETLSILVTLIYYKHVMKFTLIIIY